MQKTKLGTIAALIATIALSWSAGADAKSEGDTCSGGSANARTAISTANAGGRCGTVTLRPA